MKDFLNGIDMIYWINLDRAKERRKNMEDVFSDEVFHGKNIERIKANDYKDGNIMNRFSVLGNNYKNTESEYACLLSHLNTLNIFSKTDLPNDSLALIFEDDATLEYKKYWKKTIQEILDSAPKDWEIIMLNYHFDFGYSPNVSLFNNFELNNYRFFSALSYIVKKSSAEKIMKEMYQNSIYYIDPTQRTHHADGYLFSKLRTYIYKYPYFTYKTENTSDLHPGHLDNHKRSKLHIQKLLYDNNKNNQYNLNNILEGFISTNESESTENMATIETIEKNISVIIIIILFVLFLYVIYTKRKPILRPILKFLNAK